jgi:hypothetical protein
MPEPGNRNSTRAVTTARMKVMREGTGILCGSTMWRGLLLLGLFLYCAISASFDAFTAPMRVATSLPIAAAIAVAIREGWHRRGPVDQEPPLPRVTPATVVATAAWVGLLTVTGVFQFALYRSQPRELYPTLSALAGEAFGVAPVRAVAFAAWLALGAYLLARR